jgi:hypothetical protein
MKKFFNILIVLLAITYVILAFTVPDAEIYIAGEFSGNEPNIFGLIVGGFFVLAILSNIWKGNSSNAFSVSKYLVGVTLLNILFVFFDFTANSSSMLSENVSQVRNMGMTVSAELTDEAYYFLIIAVIILGMSWYNTKLKS